MSNDDRAEWLGDDGEMYITLDGHDFRVDRLVWLMTTGYDPRRDNIRHRDGNPANTSYGNLSLIDPDYYLTSDTKPEKNGA